MISITKQEGMKYINKTVMSNFDHSIDVEVASRLENDPSYFAQYAGYNFCGYVYFHDNKWKCEVWTYGSPDETIQAENLEEIMEQVCEKYGND